MPIKYKHRRVGRIFKYKDRQYETGIFDDNCPHVEPCPYCEWGGKVVIGTYTQVVNGVKKTFHESGFTCSRPKDFPQHCVCINRKDNRNVYFRRYEAKRQCNHRVRVCHLRRVKVCKLRNKILKSTKI